MSLDGQMEKLSALYDEKSDGELLDLFEQREGLTAVAQQALLGVMRRRGLETHRGGGEAPEVSAGGSAGGAVDVVEEDRVGTGEVLAYMFHDAFEAREALRVLTEAGIAHRMLDWHVVRPERPPHPLGLDLGLVVERSERERAAAVLKDELRLFALPEQGEQREGVGEDDSMEVLSMFERGDALVAARALGEARMSYRWRDGSEVGSDLPDGETVAIEVNAEDVARATQVVEDALAGH
jgi:hypothetical protein